MAAAVRASTKKSANSVGTGGTTTPGITTVTGDTLVVQVDDPNTSITVEDNKGNTFTENGSSQEATPNINRIRHFRCENANGGASHTVTVKWTSGSGDPSIFFLALSGCATSSYDSGSLANATDGSSPFTVTSGTLAQADSIVIGGICSGETSHTSYSNSSGFTREQEETNDGSFWPGAIFSKVVSATTGVALSVTNSGAANTALKIAAYKAAAAGGNFLKAVGPTFGYAGPSGAAA